MKTVAKYISQQYQCHITDPPAEGKVKKPKENQKEKQKPNQNPTSYSKTKLTTKALRRVDEVQNPKLGMQNQRRKGKSWKWERGSSAPSRVGAARNKWEHKKRGRERYEQHDREKATNAPTLSPLCRSWPNFLGSALPTVVDSSNGKEILRPTLTRQPCPIKIRSRRDFFVSFRIFSS